jgi:DNA-binding transcriptional LysR family regulator
MAPFELMAGFAAVVRAGGFTAAAASLGTSKQTLSDQVARLEAQLGVRLLDRSTRRVRVTEIGERYYQQCEAMIATAAAAQRELQESLRAPSGLLRVASTVTFGEVFLVDVVAHYLERFPGVRVDLRLQDRPVHVLDEGFDVAFWYERPADSQLHARKLGPALAYHVASPGYLERHGVPASPKAIPESARIDWTATAGADRGAAGPRLRVNSARAATAAARAGVGIARVPSILVHDDVAQGRLTLLFGGRPSSETEIHAIYPAGPAGVARAIPPKLAEFLALAAEQVPRMGPIAPAPPSASQAPPAKRARRGKPRTSG